MTDYDKCPELLIDVLDKCHEMSMSDDEHEAVTGRCLKEFYEQFDNFERRECERGVHRGVVIYGMVHAMAVISASTALSGCYEGCERRALDNVITLFTDTANNVFDNGQENRRVDREDT